MAFIRLLLLIIFLYLIFKFIIRLVVSFSRGRSYFAGNENQPSNRKREGEVSVDYKSASKEKKIPKDEGEYVKYEEIKEERKS